MSEVAERVRAEFGQVDILVHSLAYAPEVTKPLLETSREGYGVINLCCVSSLSPSHLLPFSPLPGLRLVPYRMTANECHTAIFHSTHLHQKRRSALCPHQPRRHCSL
mmetsp:Transcript_10945/g.22806  ORF Transcript_10945/g.22806 Transcript_10945/m.22806 type:complete len:107 (-) Transcript_10945:831-1151(-)